MSKEQALQRQIRKEYAFLLEAFGFKESTHGEERPLYDVLVCYELNALLIEIFIQPRGSEFEVGVNFSRKTNDRVEEKYAFHTYLGLVNAPLYYRLGFSIAKSNNEVTELLEIYSKALKTDGLRILNNNDEVFLQVKDAAQTGKGLCLPYYMQPEQSRIISKFV